MTLIVLIGLPGSGKSTWAEAQQKTAQHTYVSPDADLYTEGVYRWSTERAEAAWRNAYQRCGEALMSAEKSVIFDATFTGRIQRSALVNMAKGMGHSTTGVLFDTPLDTCFQRNEARSPDRRVPAAKLAMMASQLQPPTREEFDAVVVVTP